MKYVLMTLVFLGSLNTFAAKADHPCVAIKDACKSAGFVKGKHSDKHGLYKDCVEPLMNGQAVPGVNIGGDVVAACKAKKESHRK